MCPVSGNPVILKGDNRMHADWVPLGHIWSYFHSQYGPLVTAFA